MSEPARTRTLLGLCLCAVGLVAPGSLAQAAEVPMRIAAAADLQPVLPALISEFEKRHPGEKVVASYQSSATLTTQIVSGAPFDLFLAADLSFPQRVVAAGLADSAEPIAYARGTLVLWARKDSRFQPLSLSALRQSSALSISVANPEHAPYGRAASAALANLKMAEGSKISVAENIAQAAQFVDSGNTDLGLISLTSALTARLTADGNYVEVPASLYPPIVQGAVVIKNGSQQRLAHEFLDFLLSEKTRQMLSVQGLKPPA